MKKKPENEYFRSLTIILFILTLSFSSRAEETEIYYDVFINLVETVENDTVNDALPLYLEEIVNDYYAEATVPETVATDVLSYLTDIYSEHNYHASGSWVTAKTSPRMFVPYKGELPDYELNDFQSPAEGHLTSAYGYRPRFHRFHRGVDIALELGDTVKCALPGVVTTIGYEKRGYGRYVVVTHSGGMETLYGHLQTSLVKPGQKVSAGEALGLGGTSGNATGPHLHFETRYRGVAIDPLSWFRIPR